MVIFAPKGVVGLWNDWIARVGERNEQIAGFVQRCRAADRAMSEPVLRTDGLTKRFGGLTAVDNLSFSLAGLAAARHHRPERRRQDHLLQSDFRPAAAGCRAAYSSAASDITGLAPHQISRLGIKRTLQIKSVFPQLTVAENLWITKRAGHGFLHPFRAASVRSRDDRGASSARSSRSAFPALASRQAGTLSYGDVALLEIGMAVISEPRLLLLDEPTCGMSPAETERAVDKIRETGPLDRHHHHRARHGGRVRDRRRHHRDGAGRDPRLRAVRRRSLPTSGCAKPTSAAPEDEDYVEEAAHA